MRIFLAGATGFIGGHLLHELTNRGHEITCLVRPGSHLPEGRNVRVIKGRWTRPKSWAKELAGHDAVVNAIGIRRQRLTARYSAIHTRAAIEFFKAASASGVHRIIQVSAMGAAPDACCAFLRSKFLADRYLEQLPVSSVILRPSVVYGPGDQAMPIFRRLASLPITPIAGDGTNRLQPVHVYDLTRALVIALEKPTIEKITADMGGAQILSFDQLTDILAFRQGKPNGARKFHIPWSIVACAALATTLLGGYGPITIGELRMLRKGSFGDNSQFIEHFGFEPRAFI